MAHFFTNFLRRYISPNTPIRTYARVAVRCVGACRQDLRASYVPTYAGSAL